MEETALVRQALVGQAEAYGELAARWAGRITALCHARVARADVAGELAQEALLRGLESLASLADPERFGPWLTGIASNVCADWLKSRQNGPAPFSGHVTLDRGGATDTPGPEAQRDRPDEFCRLLAEVEALPEECRTVLMLYYYQDLTYRDLAHMLDVSPATVNARLTRARALLRARLGAPLSPTERSARNDILPMPPPPHPGPGAE